MDPRALDTLADHFTGKRVLVTGAAGSIGSELCRILLSLGISTLTLVSLTESGLYRVNKQLRALKSSTDIRPVLGSVANEKFIKETVRNHDIVIHAAAHKHVPLCEVNPLEAIWNNVFGTKALVEASIDADVLQYMQISTDKAVKPMSVMGRTKAVAEAIVRRARGRLAGPCFSTVRFGNVMDSDGSVLPLWREQILAGGPVTVTDPRCTRYFMTIPNACDLVLHACEFGRPGTFVFDMGEPVRIMEVAEKLCMNHMMNTFGPKIEIKITGLRPGEKLHEELHVGGPLLSTPHPKIMRVDETDVDCLALLDLADLEHAVLTRQEVRALDILKEMTSAR